MPDDGDPVGHVVVIVVVHNNGVIEYSFLFLLLLGLSLFLLTSPDVAEESERKRCRQVDFQWSCSVRNIQFLPRIWDTKAT